MVDPWRARGGSAGVAWKDHHRWRINTGVTAVPALAGVYTRGCGLRSPCSGVVWVCRVESRAGVRAKDKSK